MAVVAGRTNRLYGWNAYDWSNTYRYLAAGWTVTPTATSKDMSVAIVVPAAHNKVGAKMGVVFGLKSGQGYERRSRLVDVATGTVRIPDLQPSQSYYLMPIMVTADGQQLCGPETTAVVMQP